MESPYLQDVHQGLLFYSIHRFICVISMDCVFAIMQKCDDSTIFARGCTLIVFCCLSLSRQSGLFVIA